MSDLTRKLEQTKQALRAHSGVADAIRVFFEPRPCPDPEAFADRCRTEAAGAQTIIVRFLSPADRRPYDGTLQ